MEAAEKAAHKNLFYCHVKDTQKAKEIFCEDLDILIGKVKEAIIPFLIEGSLEKNHMDKNKWILDFINNLEDIVSEDIKWQTLELLNRAASKSKGGPNERVERPKELNEILKDKNIGTIVQSSFKYTNHELLALNSLNSLSKIFIELETLPYYNKSKIIRYGLENFNSNEIIIYWCDYYFDLNPNLICRCLEILHLRNFYTGRGNVYDYNYMPITRKKVLLKSLECFKNNNKNIEIIQKLFEKTMECRDPTLGFFTKVLRFTGLKTSTPFDIQIDALRYE